MSDQWGEFTFCFILYQMSAVDLKLLMSNWNTKLYIANKVLSNAVHLASLFLLQLFFQEVCQAISFHLYAGVFPWLQAGGVRLLYLALSFQHVVNPFVIDRAFTEELPAGAVSADGEV